MGNKRTNKALAAAVAALCLPQVPHAAEIAPFRITGIEAELSLGYFRDEYDTSYGGKLETYRHGTTWQEQLDILVHSYIYHPNFIRLDFGGGPVFLQNRFSSELFDHSSNEQYFNFHARANIFERKNFPLVLYYDHNYSTSPPAVADRMLLRRDRYGLDFSWRDLDPRMPTVNLSLGTLETSGGNVQRVVDESTDQLSIVLTKFFGIYGDATLNYHWMDETSRSGSRWRPITPTERVSNTLDIQTEHIIGESREFVINTYFMYKHQDQLPSLREVWFKPSLNWFYSDNLSSYYRYSYRDRTIEGTNSRFNGAFAGLSYTALEKRLMLNLDGDITNYVTEGYDEDYYRGSLNLGYLQEFEQFSIHYSAGLTLDRTDRQADEDTSPIFAERHVLKDSIPVDLNQKYVVRSTIVVRNLASTQTYVEGFDYRIIVSGDTTQIQRIPTGQISDGEEVQVDYYYETGGTAVYNGVDQSYRIDVYKGQYLRFYALYQDINRTLVSGNPTLPLNSSTRQKAGFFFDIPFGSDWMVGGRLEYEDYTDEIIPYWGHIYHLYLQAPTPLNGQLRIFGDREIIEKDGSPEDIDLTRWGLRFSSSPWRRATLTADYIDEKDVGGTRERANTSASLRLDWALRQLTLTVDAVYNSDSIDLSERERTRFEIWLSRRF